MSYRPAIERLIEFETNLTLAGRSIYDVFDGRRATKQEIV